MLYCTINEEVNDALICMGDQAIMNKKFMVGAPVNIEDFKHITHLNRLLQQNSCHLSCNRDKILETLNLTLNLYGM